MQVTFSFRPRQFGLANALQYTLLEHPRYFNVPQVRCYVRPGGLKNLRCKKFIVTGGAQGIGLHLAQTFLDAGAAAVLLADVLTCRCQEAACKLNRRYGSIRAYALKVDVTKQEEMESMYVLAKKKFGDIDVVVNNAGMSSNKNWDKTVSVNLEGLVRGTLLALKHLAGNKSKGGYVINMSSTSGLGPDYTNPICSACGYFSIGFGRSIGADYFCKDANVKVMTLCTGPTDTGYHERKIGGFPTFPNLGNEMKEKAKCVQKQTVEDVGLAVLQMLEDGESGSVWVAENKEVYKCMLPSREKFKPARLRGRILKGPECKLEKKGDGDKKNVVPGKPLFFAQDSPRVECKEDPCKKKVEPDKKKDDSCKKKDPCRKEDLLEKKEVIYKKKEEPPKKTEKPSKKPDPDKKNEVFLKKKEEPCKNKEVPPKEEDPSKKKEDPCKGKDVNPCEAKEDPCKKKELCKEPKKEPPKKEEPSKKKEPCKTKDPPKKEEPPKKKDPGKDNK